MYFYLSGNSGIKLNLLNKLIVLWREIAVIFRFKHDDLMIIHFSDGM